MSWSDFIVDSWFVKLIIFLKQLPYISKLIFCRINHRMKLHKVFGQYEQIFLNCEIFQSLYLSIMRFWLRLFLEDENQKKIAELM